MILFKTRNSLYETNICVLLKKGEEENDLLNHDQKVRTKVLATKLGKHISKIVHLDQTGFIPGGFSFSSPTSKYIVLKP